MTKLLGLLRRTGPATESSYDSFPANKRETTRTSRQFKTGHLWKFPGVTPDEHKFTDDSWIPVEHP